MSQIKRGDKVMITDASGVEHEARAVSGVEQGHNFPVVWVLLTTRGSTDRVPWPADSVRLAEEVKS